MKDRVRHKEVTSYDDIEDVCGVPGGGRSKVDEPLREVGVAAGGGGARVAPHRHLVLAPVPAHILLQLHSVHRAHLVVCLPVDASLVLQPGLNAPQSFAI